MTETPPEPIEEPKPPKGKGGDGDRKPHDEPN